MRDRGGVAFFFFNDTAPPEISTLSLPDALPICRPAPAPACGLRPRSPPGRPAAAGGPDRKSTRLNSRHTIISYAVFFLKKNSAAGRSRAPQGHPLPRTTKLDHTAE